MVLLESQILGSARTAGCEGKQFGRYACGFTPACGSKVGVVDTVVLWHG
jgi:hypothetical protein